MQLKSALIAISLCAFAGAASAQVPAAVTTDPPLDKAHPAAMDYVRIPSHGALLNGVVYTASGAGLHPGVVLLHGFPGNEQNLDLAQAIRRAGFNVLTLHYRGSWGSPGNFSFTHAVEDSDAAIAFMSGNAAKYATEPAKIFVVGHSMGGWLASSATDHAPNVAGLVMISAWDIGAQGPHFRDPAVRKKMAAGDFGENVIPLAGTTADALMLEAAANASQWDFVDYAPALKSRPVLIITANDGLTPDNVRLGKALRAAGDKDVNEIHMETDHPYSDHRIALESAIVNWLASHAAPATH
jgi:pimeloyl-ACP methyl ester carboxylesterase